MHRALPVAHLQARIEPQASAALLNRRSSIVALNELRAVVGIGQKTAMLFTSADRRVNIDAGIVHGQVFCR